ncbi:MAG: HPt (histidine-containing phosphotransfer) domain-containing protein [Planctomycetota bacterium]|jgi:HPt (histidine-containing phosphotransfer) domain-containing protein
MTNTFPFDQHLHGGSNAEQVLAQSSIDELLSLGGEMGGELLVDLVDLYLEDAAERVKVTFESFEAGDAEGVSRAAHALKSASANMGALPFSRLCADLEHMGGESSAEPSALAPLVDRMKAMHPEVEQALVALRAIYQA